MGADIKRVVNQAGGQHQTITVGEYRRSDSEVLGIIETSIGFIRYEQSILPDTTVVGSFYAIYGGRRYQRYFEADNFLSDRQLSAHARLFVTFILEESKP